jgi:propionate CoA-transferase
MFFVNFEGLQVTTKEQIDAIWQQVASRLSGVRFKPQAIVNYDNFSINPELIDIYSTTITRLVNQFYSSVTRYTTSSFLRMKLGDALEQRDVATYINERPGDASTHR